jgi:hypothetical protein
MSDYDDDYIPQELVCLDHHRDDPHRGQPASVTVFGKVFTDPDSIGQFWAAWTDEERAAYREAQSAVREGRCRGQVEYRMPLSGTGRSFPRCDKHWSDRLDTQERINRDYPDSPIPPAWFDPANAGEVWDYDN